MSEAFEFRHMGGGRKGLFLLLRYVFIVAASYLVLLQQGGVNPVHGLMIAAALASNVALSVASPAVVFSWYVEAPILIADTLWVSWALHSAGAAGQEFFLLYFFVLSLAAIGESLALVLCGSTVLSLANLYLTGWHPNNLIQVVFFYTVALFYGYVIKQIKAERQRADRGVVWVRQLEAMVAERTQELSRLYDALTESEARYRAVSEMTSDFAFAATASAGRFAFDWATESFKRISGYDIQECGDGGWARIVHPEDIPLARSAGSSLGHGEPFVGELRIVTRDGEVRRLRIHCKMVGASDDGVRRVFGAGQDVTARARLEEEQARLLEVLEATPDLVGISDPGGSALYFNAAGRRMLGIGDEADIAQLRIEDFQPEWAARTVREEAVPVALREGSWQGETAVRGLHGSEVPVSQVVVAHRGRDGRVSAYSTVARDITEQKQLEDVLQQEVRISTAIARAGRKLIAVLDADLVVDRLCRMTPDMLQCHASATLLFRPDTADLVPIGWFGGDVEAVPLQGVAMSSAWHQAITEALRGEDVVEVHHSDAGNPLAIPALRRDYDVVTTLYMALRRGEELIGVHTASYVGGGGTFSAAQKRIARGIASLASLALENARLTASLEQANRLKSEFVATMSHELRTPLNVILGFTDLLREGEYGRMSAEQRIVCDRIEQSGWNLLELINSTLDLSRLEQGKLKVEMSDTDVRRLLDQLRSEVAPLLEHKPSVKMLWQAPLDLPPVCTDAAKLKVVIKNLVTNALKFTDGGSVRVSVTAPGGYLVIEVADSGMGIPREQLTVIFEPFRQVDGSATRRHDGVGLGLHIVSRYAALLGGDVSVESEEGVGSVFRVSIPRHPDSGAEWRATQH